MGDSHLFTQVSCTCCLPLSVFNVICVADEDLSWSTAEMSKLKEMKPWFSKWVGADGQISRDVLEVLMVDFFKSPAAAAPAEDTPAEQGSPTSMTDTMFSAVMLTTMLDAAGKNCKNKFDKLTFDAMIEQKFDNIVNKYQLNQWWLHNESLGSETNGLAHLISIGGYVYFDKKQTAKHVKAIVGTSVNERTNTALKAENIVLSLRPWEMLPVVCRSKMCRVQKKCTCLHVKQAFHQTTFYNLRLAGITEFRWV